MNQRPRHYSRRRINISFQLQLMNVVNECLCTLNGKESRVFTSYCLANPSRHQKTPHLAFPSNMHYPEATLLPGKSPKEK